jgi:hypothetical protein
MTFLSITEEEHGRILGARVISQGVELAICKLAAEGVPEVMPGTQPVIIPRATRHWIAQGLQFLQWDEGDCGAVAQVLRDPRLEMPTDHPLRSHALELPSTVMPQDGYRQLASVWHISGPRFAACIWEDAKSPIWWGTQIAGLMEHLVMQHLTTVVERKGGLDILSSAYQDALTVREEEHPSFATRFDSFGAEQSAEIIAVWAAPQSPTVLITSREAFNTTSLWGVAIAALTSEIVDTLADERGEPAQQVFLSLTAAFESGLAEAYTVIEAHGTTLH